MASEIRVDKINSLSGVGTVTLSPTGVDISGITTVQTLKVGTGLTASEDGDVFFTGVCTATTFAGAHSGSGANLTSLPAAQLSGTLPALSAANLTSIPAANLTGALPAISGANLTGIAATDNVRTGILDVAGIATFRSDVNIPNINGGQIGGRRNIIINGAMMVAQRGTSSNSTGYTTVDRFSQSASNLNNNCDIAQEGLTSGNAYDNGFRKSYKVTNGDNNADSDDQSKINHLIEAQDLANSGWNHKSASSNVTLSFWVKSSVAQTFSVAIYAEDANMGYGFEYSATTSWTKITHTIPGHASLGINNDNGTGFNIQWYLYMGTATTSSSFTNADWHTYSGSSRSKDMTTTWQTTNDATFEITGVQLEVGSTATAFEHRSYGEELSLCQRYYYRHASGAAGANIGIAAVYQSNNIFPIIDFPCTMRTTPSLDVSDSSGYFRVYSNGDSDSFDTFSSLWNVGNNAVGVNAYSADGISGRTGGHAAMVICDHASAHISFSAEL